jgi:teichuronic acid biosynthesis glycosyltransferase TuaH
MSSDTGEPRWPLAVDSLVVLRAANDWDGPWFADQQLAVALSKSVRVLYVDPARSYIERDRGTRTMRPSLQKVGDRLTRLSPTASPFTERAGVASMTRALVARQIRASAKSLGAPIEVLIDCAPLVPVMGTCGERRRVYWAQDDFEALASIVGLSPTRMGNGVRRLVSQADLVIAANTTVAESLEDMGTRITLIPFGCDAEHFERAITSSVAPDIALPSPIAGFMGHIGERIDVEMLRAVAQTGTSLLIVGPWDGLDRASLDELLSWPNVQWVGAKSFGTLPSYLAAVDVGLVPYTHSPFNEGSFPLKTLEYLASGRPVISTDLPATRWLDSDFITVADTPETFAAAVLTSVETVHDEPYRRSVHEFARTHTWDVRAADFISAMSTIPPAA